MSTSVTIRIAITLTKSI